MKLSPAKPEHLAFRKAMEETIAIHGTTLQADELLAVLAHLVGQVIALQDQTKMTPAMACELVSDNIEQGNREVVNGLLGGIGGTA